MVEPDPSASSAASGCVFLDASGRVLLVKPAYKEPWEVPGGGVEPAESPLDACRRELREELSIDFEPGRLLCVDHRLATADGRPDALRFLFDGGTLSDAEAESFRLDPVELLEWRFVAVDELDHYVVPVLARRLRSVLGAREFVYLEDGVPPESHQRRSSSHTVS